MLFELFDHDGLDICEFFGGVGFEAEGEVWCGVGGADCGPGCVVEFDADAVDGEAVVEFGEVGDEFFDDGEFFVVRTVGFEFLSCEGFWKVREGLGERSW